MLQRMSALLLLLAAATPAAAKSAGSDWKIALCEKACIAPHDAKVLGCKALSPREGPDCVTRADAERAACEKSCRAPRKKTGTKKKPTPRGSS